MQWVQLHPNIQPVGAYLQCIMHPPIFSGKSPFIFLSINPEVGEWKGHLVERASSPPKKLVILRPLYFQSRPLGPCIGPLEPGMVPLSSKIGV